MNEKLAFVIERKWTFFGEVVTNYYIELSVGGYIGPDETIVTKLSEARAFPRQEVAEGIAKGMGYTLL